MLSVTIGLGLLAFGFGVACIVLAVQLRKDRLVLEREYNEKVASFEKKIDNIQFAARCEKEKYDAAVAGAKQRFVTIQAFDDTQRGYVRTMAQLADMPELRFFLHALSMAAHGKLCDVKDLEEKKRWAYYVESYAMFSDAMAIYKSKWNEMTTEKTPVEAEDGEVSLS